MLFAHTTVFMFQMILTTSSSNQSAYVWEAQEDASSMQ
jgi:hypothetical protein